MTTSVRTLKVAEAREIAERLLGNLAKVILGKGQEERLAVMALMSRGHLLIEDVPGVGKTMLARSIAKSIDGSFRRIQFTPDLLPADITGVSIFNQKEGEFEYRGGAYRCSGGARRRDQPGFTQDAGSAP